MTPRLTLLLALAIALFGCGRRHTLQDGTYQFRLDSVIRDDCNLASTGRVLEIGQIRTSGHAVVMDYQILGTPLQLVGNYLDQDFTNSDRMRLDGSAANQTAFVNGTECLLDLVVLHLDSLTTGPRSFGGTFSVDYQSPRHNECVCQFWFNYIAIAADATDSGS